VVKDPRTKKQVVYAKGAPEQILAKCTHVIESGKVKKLTAAKKKAILKQNDTFANNALRVLGFAYKPFTLKAKMEQKLIFVGLQAMIDPPREEVGESIVKCRSAGIRTVVITGDHKLTAITITKELGLFKEGDKALSGEELDKLSDDELDEIVEKIGDIDMFTYLCDDDLRLQYKVLKKAFTEQGKGVTINKKQIALLQELLEQEEKENDNSTKTDICTDNRGRSSNEDDIPRGESVEERGSNADSEVPSS